MRKVKGVQYSAINDEGMEELFNDTRLLKRLKKAKVMEDAFEKGCWLTSGKGPVQQTVWEGNSWPWASGEGPCMGSPTRPPLTVESQATSQKTCEKLSVLGVVGDEGHAHLWIPQASEESVGVFEGITDISIYFDYWAYFLGWLLCVIILNFFLKHNLYSIFREREKFKWQLLNTKIKEHEE